MDVISIITSICAVIGTSSIISGLVLRRIDKLEKALERREADKVTENVARGEVLHTVGHLAEANTLALRLIANSDVCSLELSQYREAIESLEHFTREKSAEYLHAN